MTPINMLTWVLCHYYFITRLHRYSVVITSLLLSIHGSDLGSLGVVYYVALFSILSRSSYWENVAHFDWLYCSEDLVTASVHCTYKIFWLPDSFMLISTMVHLSRHRHTDRLARRWNSRGHNFTDGNDCLTKKSRSKSWKQGGEQGREGWM